MLREKFNKSLRFKFLSIMFGILFLGTLTDSLFIAIHEKRALKDSLTNMGQTFASYIAKLSKEPLILKNSIQLDAIVDDANRDENIVYAVIYDNKGVPLTAKYPSINYRLPAIKNILLTLSRDHDFRT